MKVQVAFSLLVFNLLLHASSAVKAQTNTFPATGSAGIGTLSPNASSILEVKSTSKGLLIPRMTQVQRNAIVTPATGLMIFQTNATPGFYYYNGSSWTAVSTLGANRTLNNLTSPVAVNKDLLPDSTFTRDLGSATKTWRNAYIRGSVGIGTVTPAAKLEVAFGDALINGLSCGLGGSGLPTNTVFGKASLASNVSGIENTAVGDSTLFSNYKGSLNTAVGFGALFSNFSGRENTAVGDSSLYQITSGSFNTAIGSNTNVANKTLDNIILLGYNAAVGVSNKARIGNSSITSIGGQVNWTAFSDARIKDQVSENVPGLSFINKLRPVTYHYNVARENELLGIPESPKWEKKYDIEKIQFSGFLAQEVDAVAQQIGYDFSGVDKSGDLMGLRYAEFVVPIVKSVQELASQNNELKKENEFLKNENTRILARLDAVEKNVSDLNAIGPLNKSSQSPILVDSRLAKLYQNEPNPFAGQTGISYFVPKGFKSAQIVVADLQGHPMKNYMINNAGNGTWDLAASNMTVGSYVYTLIVDGIQVHQFKMELIK